ncbi:MAG: hypothetical protein IJV16_08020 [Lachnospiraceae bacterium]|nr:hypothetical protein [Lachnospiraceae bacterium]
MAYFLGGVGAGIIIALGFWGWVVGRHKRVKSLTKFVMFSIAALLIYTMCEFTFAITKNTAHDTLTTCFYACFGGEILSCALIKIFKLRHKEDNEGDYDDPIH